MDMIQIRTEEPKDYEVVKEVNRQAFETDTEAKLIENIRADKSVISLVAIKENQVVGHILFSAVNIEDAGNMKLMALGPMAVLPQLQKMGIGSKLIKDGINKCKSLETKAVFVLGHSNFYPRFGFQNAREKGFFYKDSTFDAHFMVLELFPGEMQNISGEVKYHHAFDSV